MRPNLLIVSKALRRYSVDILAPATCPPCSPITVNSGAAVSSALQGVAQILPLRLT